MKRGRVRARLPLRHWCELLIIELDFVLIVLIIGDLFLFSRLYQSLGARRATWDTHVIVADPCLKSITWTFIKYIPIVDGFGSLLMAKLQTNNNILNRIHILYIWFLKFWKYKFIYLYDLLASFRRSGSSVVIRHTSPNTALSAIFISPLNLFPLALHKYGVSHCMYWNETSSQPPNGIIWEKCS